MKKAIHFVGFKGDEYYLATQVFGEPDFIHRQNDGRFRSMMLDGDEAVFANGAEVPSSSVYSFDDSAVM